jgi:hypothetical protein
MFPVTVPAPLTSSSPTWPPPIYVAYGATFGTWCSLKVNTPAGTGLTTLATNMGNITLSQPVDILATWQGSMPALRTSGTLPSVNSPIRRTLPRGMMGIAITFITNAINARAILKVYSNTAAPGPTGTSYAPNDLGYWSSSGSPSFCSETATSPSPGCPNCSTRQCARMLYSQSSD